jgi:hypothetical protein
MSAPGDSVSNPTETREEREERWRRLDERRLREYAESMARYAAAIAAEKKGSER